VHNRVLVSWYGCGQLGVLYPKCNIFAFPLSLTFSSFSFLFGTACYRVKLTNSFLSVFNWRLAITVVRKLETHLLLCYLFTFLKLKSTFILLIPRFVYVSV